MNLPKTMFLAALAVMIGFSANAATDTSDISVEKEDIAEDVQQELAEYDEESNESEFKRYALEKAEEKEQEMRQKQKKNSGSFFKKLFSIFI